MSFRYPPIFMLRGDAAADAAVELNDRIGGVQWNPACPLHVDTSAHTMAPVCRAPVRQVSGGGRCGMCLPSPRGRPCV